MEKVCFWALVVCNLSSAMCLESLSINQIYENLPLKIHMDVPCTNLTINGRKFLSGSTYEISKTEGTNDIIIELDTQKMVLKPSWNPAPSVAIVQNSANMAIYASPNTGEYELKTVGSPFQPYSQPHGYYQLPYWNLADSKNFLTLGNDSKIALKTPSITKS